MTHSLNQNEEFIFNRKGFLESLIPGTNTYYIYQIYAELKVCQGKSMSEKAKNLI